MAYISLSFNQFKFRCLCRYSPPHPTQEEHGGAFDLFVSPGLLQGCIQYQGCNGGKLEDFLLVLHRNAQELEGFTPGAQDLLLLPGTLFTSVLGIILGYIVLNQGIQVIFLGQLEIALLHVTDRLFDREIRITAFQEPYPLDDIGIHTQVLELP